MSIFTGPLSYSLSLVFYWSTNLPYSRVFLHYLVWRYCQLKLYLPETDGETTWKVNKKAQNKNKVRRN